ncbi:glutathione S-transferase [Morchella snyderi]|nr:glutathione S-transferase [Morchella snyderi]
MATPTPTPTLTLYSHSSGPNPWKVAIILDELNLSYNTVFIGMDGSQKSSPYIDLCPNGRMPTLVDHSNNDYTIWESGAIILYIVSKYDTEHKISFSKEMDDGLTAQALQWLMFQMSGQGPYWGQAVWFNRYHPGDKIPSAIERYTKEVRRVLGVIDLELKRGNKEWLVGGKCSYADLSFVSWNWYLDTFFAGTAVDGWRDEYPHTAAWEKRLLERESVRVNSERRAAAIAAEAAK